MKLTKKAIYEKHGIQFDGDKILSPIGPVCELLKEGNGKTGKHVYTFSILPGTGVYEVDVFGRKYFISGTCGCDCKGCYAKTGRYNCDNVIHSYSV